MAKPAAGRGGEGVNNIIDEPKFRFSIDCYPHPTPSPKARRAIGSFVAARRVYCPHPSPPPLRRRGGFFNCQHALGAVYNLNPSLAADVALRGRGFTPRFVGWVSEARA